MQDFDVNEDEYKHLPVHMQATSPPSVQEVERNEKLHKESWLPLSMEEEEKEDEQMVNTKEEVVSEENQAEQLQEEQTAN